MDTAHITERNEFDKLKEQSITRAALEMAAKAVESLSGTRHYQSAFKKAARKIRALKPE